MSIRCIQESIFDRCSTKTLVLLLRTGHVINRAVNVYMEERFNVTHFLLRYFFNPIAFLHLQACTGSLISGSSALQFFDRPFYPDSNLEIYVSMLCSSQVVIFSLAQGYTCTRHSNSTAPFSERRTATVTGRYGNVKDGIAGVSCSRRICPTGPCLSSRFKSSSGKTRIPHWR